MLFRYKSFSSIMMIMQTKTEKCFICFIYLFLNRGIKRQTLSLFLSLSLPRSLSHSVSFSPSICVCVSVRVSVPVGWDTRWCRRPMSLPPLPCGFWKLQLMIAKESTLASAQRPFDCTRHQSSPHCGGGDADRRPSHPPRTFFSFWEHLDRLKEEVCPSWV